MEILESHEEPASAVVTQPEKSAQLCTAMGKEKQAGLQGTHDCTPCLVSQIDS